VTTRQSTRKEEDVNPLHDEMLRQHQERFTALVGGLLSAARDFGVNASARPRSDAHWNATERLSVAARDFHLHVSGAESIGLPIPALPEADDGVRGLIDRGLEYGAAHTQGGIGADRAWCALAKAAQTFGQE
jgi:hypothetical protein